MKNRIIASIVVIGLAFIGFNYLLPASKNGCVNVYIDFGSLANQNKITKCVDVSGTTGALDIMSKGGFDLQGTAKYGNQIVCRVNNLPSPKEESCETMPPENAYWAVLLKNKKTILNMFGPSWGWAQTGIDKVNLKPGDTIGLVFSVNGKTPMPK